MLVCVYGRQRACIREGSRRGGLQLGQARRDSAIKTQKRRQSPLADVDGGEPRQLWKTEQTNVC